MFAGMILKSNCPTDIVASEDLNRKIYKLGKIIILNKGGISYGA